MDAVSLAAIAALFILLFALSAHRYQSWLAPTPLWNLCWAALFAATAFLGHGFDYPPGPVSVLALLAAAYNIPGFLLNSSITRTAEAKSGAQIAAFTPPIWLVLAAGLIGAIGLVRLGQELGTSVLSIRSFDQLFSAGQTNATAIFRGEARLSFIVNVTFSALQLGAALAGARIAIKPTKRAVVAAGVLLVIAFLWSSITTQRSYILVPIVWFAAAYVASLVWMGRRKIPGRAVFWSAVGGGALVLAIVFLRAVRTNGMDAGFSEATFAPTRLWLAGYIPTFAAWYKQAEESGLSFGLFNGIVALAQPLLGIRGADDGGESNYYSIGSGLTSNAGTSMMRIVGDGGMVWGLLTVLTLATIAHVVYVRAARGGPVAAATYIGVVAFTLWSTNAWFLGYGGRVLALIGLMVLAGMAGRRLKRKLANLERPRKKPRSRRRRRPSSATRTRRFFS